MINRWTKWFNTIDEKLDNGGFTLSQMIILGVGGGIIFWGLLAVVLAAFGSL
jgi:hypothetical protein